MKSVSMPSLVLASLLLAPSVLPAAEAPWIEVRTPGFVVVTNASEKDTRHLAWQFEQVRSVFRTAWPWARTEPGRSFVVLGARDEATMRVLAPEYWERKTESRPATVWVSEADRDWVAINLDGVHPDEPGSNPYVDAYSSYAGIVIGASFPGRAPYWYERGLMKVFGNTVVHSDDIQVGRPVGWMVRLLNQSVRMPLAQVVAMDRKAVDALSADGRRLFDAESWALVNYLAFADQGAYLPRLNKYSSLLRNGVAADAAFRSALGDPTALQDGVREYMKRKVVSFSKMNVSLEVKADGFRVRTLSAPEAAAMRAGFLAACRRPVEAKALLDTVRASGVAVAAAHQVEALMLDRDGKTDEARAAYAKAVELGSDDYYVLFRHADLLRRGSQDAATLQKVEALLSRALERSPEAVDALSELAEVQADLGASDKAILAAQKAVRLEPGRPRPRLSLAYAYWRASQLPAARAELEHSLTLTGDEWVRGEAQRMLRDLKGDIDADRANALQTACRGGDDAVCAQWATTLATRCQGTEADRARSCSLLGWLYDNGRGMPKDAGRAASLYTQACDGGETFGCLGAGVLKMRAEGKARDLAGAEALFHKACRSGSEDGCANVAYVYLQRSGPGDLGRARTLLEASCQKGHAGACATLEKMPKAARR